MLCHSFGDRTKLIMRCGMPMARIRRTTLADHVTSTTLRIQYFVHFVIKCSIAGLIALRLWALREHKDLNTTTRAQNICRICCRLFPRFRTSASRVSALKARRR